jgi:hypothetical protein
VVKLTAAGLLSDPKIASRSSRMLSHHRSSECITTGDFGKSLAFELESFLNSSPGSLLALTIVDEVNNNNTGVGGGGGGAPSSAAAGAAAGASASGSSGTFLLAGPPALISVAGPVFAAVVNGRGGGKGDKFQGKCTNVDKYLEAVQAAEEAIKDLLI